jgi:hypothetical protein
MYKIPFMFSVKSTLILLLLISLFNACVMLQLVPYTIVWGGRLKSYDEMLRFETISIIINLFSGLMVLVKGDFVLPKWKSLINPIIWILPVLNFLGILGNAVSKSDTERMLFLPFAIIMFFLTLRIAMEKAGSKQL